MRFVPLIAAALALAGIGGAPPAHAQRELQSSDDPFVHPVAKVAFPLEIDGYSRTRIVQYDARGSAISVGYNVSGDDAGRPFLTFYVFPNRFPGSDPAAAPSDRCMGEYSVADDEIMRAYPDAQRIGDSVPAAAPAGLAGEARIGRYRFTLRGVRHESDLYVYCVPNGNWVIKLRASWSGQGDYRAEALGVLARIGLPAVLPADPETVVAMR